MTDDDELGRDILDILDSFLTADDELKAKQVVDASPWLMDDWVDEYLAIGATRAREAGDQQMAKSIEFRLNLLRQSRQVGSREALIGPVLQRFGDAPNWAASRRVLEQSPAALLSDDALELAMEYASAEQAAGRENRAGQWAFVWQLLTDVREQGIEEAFARVTAQDTAIEQLMPAVNALLAAESPAAQREVIMAHPELLEPLATALLASLVESGSQTGDIALTRMFQDRMDVLERCRQLGIEAAFR